MGSAHQNITANAQLVQISSRGSVWHPVIWVANAKWECATDGGLFVTTEQTLVFAGTDGLHQKPSASEGQLSGSDHTPDHIIQINTDIYKLTGIRIKTATHYAKCQFAIQLEARLKRHQTISSALQVQRSILGNTTRHYGTVYTRQHKNLSEYVSYTIHFILELADC